MAEYIEKETVIANLIEQIEKGRDTAECEATELVIKRFAEYIGSFPAADVQPVDRWISVEDRLPKEQECVIVHEKDYGVMLGDYQGIKYSQPVWIVRKSGLIMRTTEVTHWQALPEPPTNKI